MVRKYDKHKIYVHNLSNFDGVFILKILASLPFTNIKPIMRDGKIIDIQLSYGRGYNIYFRDSLLFLPASLDKLAKSFNVTNKGIFPYDFANVVDLAYIGATPDIKYFYNITLNEYNDYSNNFNMN